LGVSKRLATPSNYSFNKKTFNKKKLGFTEREMCWMKPPTEGTARDGSSRPSSASK